MTCPAGLLIRNDLPCIIITVITTWRVLRVIPPRSSVVQAKEATRTMVTPLIAVDHVDDAYG